MATIVDINLKEEWAQETLGRFAEDPKKKTPFEVFVYPNFLDQKMFEQIRADVSSVVRLKQKDNDLYKFKQSKDLKSEITTKKLTPLLNSFIDAMLDQLRLKLEKSTGLKLSTKYFDITVSRYNKGDYLLCHNDDIKDSVKQHRRALAFIYYLNSRAWTRADGGALILYDSDESGEPVSVNNIIEPKPNTLIVFKTSSTSWHSVEEVYCEDDTRLSINGWFHIDKPTNIDARPMTTEPSIYKFIKPIPLDGRIEKFFKECVSSDYLMEKTCYLIRRKFKKNSEINLTNFLVKEKFDEISQVLREAVMVEENLKQVGPFNKRNYKVLVLERLPPICRDLYDAFRSELFFMLLSRLTGLDLQPPSLRQANDDIKHSSTDEDDSCDEDEEDSGDEDDVDNLEDDDSSEDDTKVDLNDIREQKEQIKANNSTDKNILEHLTKTTKTSTDEHQTAAEVQPEASSSQAPPKKRKRVSDPLARLEFRHLEPGSYTLVHDYGYELAEKSALDVILHFNHDFAVNFEDGGYISYLDGTEDDLHDMDCELLTIEPKSNCLSLAYRCDEGTCRFMKYIAKSHKLSYQDLYCVFYEKPDDLPRASDAKQSGSENIKGNDDDSNKK